LYLKSVSVMLVTKLTILLGAWQYWNKSWLTTLVHSWQTMEPHSY